MRLYFQVRLRNRPVVLAEVAAEYRDLNPSISVCE